MEDTIIVGDVSVKITGSRREVTKAMYGWSKYGGVNMGLVQEKVLPEWVCQTCAEKQTDSLPPYMFEFIPREYIRICSKCQHIKIKHALSSLNELLDFVRRSHGNY